MTDRRVTAAHVDALETGSPQRKVTAEHVDVLEQANAERRVTAEHVDVLGLVLPTNTAKVTAAHVAVLAQGNSQRQISAEHLDVLARFLPANSVVVVAEHVDVLGTVGAAFDWSWWTNPTLAATAMLGAWNGVSCDALDSTRSGYWDGVAIQPLA